MPTFASDRTHFNVAVFVLLQNEKGEYLLQQRQNTSYMNGHWDFSSSGHLERGETLKQCAVRETEEECGLKVSEDSLKLVQILQHDVGDWPYIDFLFVSLEFSGKTATNELEKVANLKWVSPRDFPEKLTLALKSYVHAGFPTDELAHVYVDEAKHEELIGEPHSASELRR